MPSPNSQALAIRSGGVGRNTAGRGMNTRSGHDTGRNRTRPNRAGPRRAGPSVGSDSSDQNGDPQSERQARQSPPAGPVNPHTQNISRDGGAARGAQTTSDPLLIQRVCLDTATAAEKNDFQDKYAHKLSFQLLAYRQLNRCCEEGTAEARKKAVLLDLALHPVLQPHLFEGREKLIHDFLRSERSRESDRAMQGQFATTVSRHRSACTLSTNLIEKVAISTATADDKELFRLKWRFDTFPDHVKKRIQKYKEVGRREEERCLSDARAQEEIDLLLERMRKGMSCAGETDLIADGGRLAHLVIKVRSGTATAIEKQSFSNQLRENFWFADSVRVLADFHGGRSSQQDKDRSDRLGEQWAIAEELLIERVAQRTATAQEAQAFKDGLDFGAIDDAVYEKDEEYRALGSVQGMREAAELRTVLERHGVRGRFQDDPNLTPYIHAAIQYHAQAA